MRQIFNYNQENFTGGLSPIPVVSVIEEAQSVLGKSLEESSPFVEWVKEGRKYDLGAILVTQQPGSMAPELLSQADNWFSFHLLSESDAGTLGRYNAHFSHDILAHLIGEPIVGNCYMWSSPGQPFVLPVRVRSFEELYAPVDGEGSFKGAPAAAINHRFTQRMAALAGALKAKLLESRTKSRKSFKEFPGELVGIYFGKLYAILKEIKQFPEFHEEYRDENELKIPLLSLALGCEITILKGEHDEKKDVDYYCAPVKNWKSLAPAP